jgi:hypothetical protein
MEAVSKKRKDIALTLNIAFSIVDRFKVDKPLIKRGHKFLLLEGTEWENKIPVGTYNSWRTRNTIPSDSVDNTGFNEILITEKNKIIKERITNLVRLSEEGIEKVLKMPLKQRTIEKRMNKEGKITSMIITEDVNSAIVNAKVKVIMFALERSNRSAYGRGGNTEKEVKSFSLSDLRHASIKG